MLGVQVKILRNKKLALHCGQIFYTANFHFQRFQCHIAIKEAENDCNGSSALKAVRVPGLHCSRCTLVLSSSPWTSLRTTWVGMQSSRRTIMKLIMLLRIKRWWKTMINWHFQWTPLHMWPVVIANCQFILIFQPEDHEARHFSFDAVLGASGKAVNLEGFKRSNFDFHQTWKKHKF